MHSVIRDSQKNCLIITGSGEAAAARTIHKIVILGQFRCKTMFQIVSAAL